MRNYQPARWLYKLSKFGETIAPHHKGKLFTLEFHPLAPGYVRAKRTDQRTKTVWAADFFEPVRGKA